MIFLGSNLGYYSTIQDQIVPLLKDGNLGKL